MPSSSLRKPVKTLLVDNYDSYTFNLFQLLAEVNGEHPVVISNDEKSIVEIREIIESGVDNIVVSPGPGNPNTQRDIGVCGQLFTEFKDVPILGVCLGHQILATQYGAKVVKGPEPIHGRVSEIRHGESELFEGIPSGLNAGFEVVRYHSLIVDPSSLPDTVRPTAWTIGRHRAVRPNKSQTHTTDHQPEILMAISHVTHPHYGVQFHPESIGTTYGIRLLQNFRDVTCRHYGRALLNPRDNVVGPPGQEMNAREWTRECKLGFKGLGLCWAKCEGVLHGERGEMDALFDEMFGACDACDTFWLDSATTDRGRFSFMGGPGGPLWKCITYKLDDPKDQSDRKGHVGGVISIRNSNGAVSRQSGNIWDYLEREVERNSLRVTKEAARKLPFNFWGGFVGYLGYELKALCGGNNVHKSTTPDAGLFLSDRLLAIDHQEKNVYCLALYPMSDSSSTSAGHWVNAAKHRVERVFSNFSTKPTGIITTTTTIDSSNEINASKLRPMQPSTSGGQFELDRPKGVYMSDIRHCMDALHSGESYEICLTNKLRKKAKNMNGRKLYSTLRRLNPAPYAAFLNFGENGPCVCCSSPERFLRGDRGGVLEARPIKGTAARHPDPLKDRHAAHELATSEKDQAENLMIVDLLRNDLGRVSETGSVHVPGLMEVESFTTVHQLVSTVRSLRSDDISIVSAIRAAFPGGSMTGAPKIRSMEILEELEQAPRGIYSGSIGYISFNHTFDLNIVIRTAVLHDNKVTIGAGGAIVVQSDVEGEYEEMMLKAKALLKAVNRSDDFDV